MPTIVDVFVHALYLKDEEFVTLSWNQSFGSDRVQGQWVEDVIHLHVTDSSRMHPVFVFYLKLKRTIVPIACIVCMPITFTKHCDVVTCVVARRSQMFRAFNVRASKHSLLKLNVRFMIFEYEIGVPNATACQDTENRPAYAPDV